MFADEKVTYCSEQIGRKLLINIEIDKDSYKTG